MNDYEAGGAENEARRRRSLLFRVKATSLWLTVRIQRARPGPNAFGPADTSVRCRAAAETFGLDEHGAAAARSRRFSIDDPENPRGGPVDCRRTDDPTTGTMPFMNSDAYYA